jgi:hypothetical protein
MSAAIAEFPSAAANASAIMPRFMEPSTLLISWRYAKWRERSPFALWRGGTRRKASSSTRCYLVNIVKCCLSITAFVANQKIKELPLP